MPERKGRKRKPSRARRDVSPGAPPESSVIRDSTPARERITSPAVTPAESSIPALRVRYAAFIVATLTLMIGVLTTVQGLTGDHATLDRTALVATGIALVLLALVIGALALVPERIAAWLRRKS